MANLYGHGKEIKPPKFRSQSDIKKIAQLREDIVLTATEHDKTIDELAEAQTEIAQLKEQLEACRNRYRTKMLDSFDADLATLRSRNAELEAEVKDRHEAEQIALAELAKADERIAELETAWSGLCKCACHDMPKHSTIQDLSEAVRFYSNKVKELEAEVARLRDAHNAMLGLINSSQGVYGLHLNGDGAPWDSLRTGGQFEAWLLDFDIALEASDESD